MKRFDDKNGTDDKKKRKRILFMAGLIAVIIITAVLFYFNSFVMKTESSKAWRKMGVLCAEMECAALFMNAARAGKEALGILTISDHMFREEAISAEARQTSFNKMMEIALGI